MSKWLSIRYRFYVYGCKDKGCDNRLGILVVFEDRVCQRLKKRTERLTSNYG